MKKIIILSLVLLMCFSVNISVCATENTETETVTTAQPETTHPIYDPEIDTAIDEDELVCPDGDLSPGICACDKCEAEAERLKKEAAKEQKKDTTTKTSGKKSSKKTQTTEVETVETTEAQATSVVSEESTETVTEIAIKTTGEDIETGKEPSVIGWIIGGTAVAAIVGTAIAVTIKKKKSK